MEKRELKRGLIFTVVFSVVAAIGISVFGDASRRLTASALTPVPVRTAESTRTPEPTRTPRPTATINPAEVVNSVNQRGSTNWRIRYAQP